MGESYNNLVGVDRMHFGDRPSAVGLEVLEKKGPKLDSVGLEVPEKQYAKAPKRRSAELYVGLEVPKKQDAEAPERRSAELEKQDAEAPGEEKC